MSLSNTSRLKQIEVKGKQCKFCTAVDVLEMTVCAATCHADSGKERRKIAIRARNTLEGRIDEVIVPAMTCQHTELRPAVADVEVKAGRIEDRIQSLTLLFTSAKAQAANVASEKAGIHLLKQRLERLADQLDSSDIELAREAGESYDLEERIRSLCSLDDEPRSLQRFSTDIRPIRSDLQRIKGDMMKQELDLGMLKVNISKRVREQGNKRPYRSEKWAKELESQRKDLSRENDTLKIRVKERDEQAKSLSAQLDANRAALDTVKTDLFALSSEHPSISPISPALMLLITSQVFGPYKRINKFKRETKEKIDTLKVQLGTLKRK